jgi:hypothetical protein
MSGKECLWPWRTQECVFQPMSTQPLVDCSRVQWCDLYTANPQAQHLAKTVVSRVMIEQSVCLAKKFGVQDLTETARSSEDARRLSYTVGWVQNNSNNECGAPSFLLRFEIL